MRNLILSILICSVCLTAWAAAADAQSKNTNAAKPAETILVPQVGVISTQKNAAVQLKNVHAHVELILQDEKTGKAPVAETTLTLHVQTTNKTPARCEIAVPVPSGATETPIPQKRDAAEKDPENRLTKPNARVMSNSLSCNYCQTATVRAQAPSLLEFYGYDLLRMSNVSVQPGETQQVSIRYRQQLKPVGNRIDYMLPKSELLRYRTPWSITATIHTAANVAAVYSPSHPITWSRESGDKLRVQVRGDATAEPGPFYLSVLQETGGITGTVFTYPGAKDRDGYFLLLLGVSKRVPLGESQKREVTFVIDRSASMRGKRLAGVCNATNTALKNLRRGEKFNIYSYNEKVQSLAKSPLVNTAESVRAADGYLKSLQPRGGSNIHDALKTCLEQPPTKDLVPLVLFFTDGTPSSGNASEAQIRRLVTSANTANRRVYTFGVGVDPMTPLLQGIADASGGRSTYILPNEDIEKKVGRVVKRLQYPILTSPKFEAAADKQTKTQPAISKIIPVRLPDFYAGEKIVILGRFRGKEKIPLRITGKYLGKDKTLQFVLAPQSASQRHRFVPRLWAGRRVAQLVDRIRQSGATAPPVYAAKRKALSPQVVEWSKEILQLTAEHGIITEYTAFLSQGGSNYSFAQPKVQRQLLQNLDDRANRLRTGKGSVSQEKNLAQKGQTRLNPRNWYWSADLQPVAPSGVQQFNNGTFFRRGNVWVDGSLVRSSKAMPPVRKVEFGSKDYTALLTQLARNGRQNALALDGKILILSGSRPVLVVPPAESKVGQGAAASKRSR